MPLSDYSKSLTSFQNTNHLGDGTLRWMPSPTLLFLFNHDAVHQVAHLAAIVRSLSTLLPSVRVRCATSSIDIQEHLGRLLGPEVISKVEWLSLSLPPWLERVLTIPNHIAPIRRMAVLDYNARKLLDCDVLVSAERTCLRLRRQQAVHGSRARFVHVPHGAGDRAVGFNPGKAGFDRILVSGEKTARALQIRAGVSREKIRIIGYTKFDTVNLDAQPKFFDNNRPTFIYNPHFDPFLSSWYDEGPKLLDWFASGEGKGFNLLFAPHIMLFRKKLHVSPEYRTARIRPDIQQRWLDARNILIDVGSERLVDMSYTLCGDAYIGDVSSQIYEFLLRPRAVFLLDRFSRNERSIEGVYPARLAGDVFSTVEELTALLPSYVRRARHFREKQIALFADTISHDPAHSASQRAVDAIMEVASE